MKIFWIVVLYALGVSRGVALDSEDVYETSTMEDQPTTDNEYHLESSEGNGEPVIALFQASGSNDCTVDLRSMSFVEIPPVYMTNGKATSTSGRTSSLVFTRTDRLTASCPGQNNHLAYNQINKGTSTTSISCVGGQLKTDWGGRFPSASVFMGGISCISVPATEEVEGVTNSHCTLIQVRLATNQVFTSCFDKRENLVLWSKHSLSAENFFSQKCKSPMEFIVSSQFGGNKLNTKYMRDNQKIAFVHLLGTDRHITKNGFLNRGHLAAKSDFVMGAWELATCHFLNVAPQWAGFNGGNWNILEQSLREKISKSNMKVDVYTGSWGKLQLPHATTKEPIDMYMDLEKTIPIPLYFFKVVYEPSTKRGYAFVGLNNPHVDKREAERLGDNLCINICIKKLKWLPWSPEIREKGYSFCCDVDSLRKKIKSIPITKITGNLF